MAVEQVNTPDLSPPASPAMRLRSLFRRSERRRPSDPNPAPAPTTPTSTRASVPRPAHDDPDKEEEHGVSEHSEDLGTASTNSLHLPISSMFTNQRNVSGPLAVESSSMSSDQSPTSWRSNPHAAPGNSKTSQYIDKITAENDRLRRELRAEKAAREEEAKRVSAAKFKAEDSRQEHQSLQLMVDTNARALERKDRKLEELKATLEAEVKRRKQAETRAEESLSLLSETRSDTQRQLAQAYELRHRAEANADAAQTGYKRILESYEKRTRAINDELKKLRKERIEDADRIKRQAVIGDQLQHELTKKNRSEVSMSGIMEQYKKEHREEVDALVREAERMRLSLPEKEQEAMRLIEELKETRDKMKWVMAQQQSQRGGSGKRR